MFCKYISGKPDIMKDYYDRLIFCARGFAEATILLTIKIIIAFEFEQSSFKSIMILEHTTQIYNDVFICSKQLAQVESETNYELRAIEEFAFSRTNLSCILIQPMSRKFVKLLFFIIRTTWKSWIWTKLWTIELSTLNLKLERFND